MKNKNLRSNCSANRPDKEFLSLPCLWNSLCLNLLYSLSAHVRVSVKINKIVHKKVVITSIGTFARACLGYLQSETRKYLHSIRCEIGIKFPIQSQCQSIEAHAHDLSVNIAKQEFHYIDLHSWYAYGKNKTYKYVAYTYFYFVYINYLRPGFISAVALQNCHLHIVQIFFHSFNF